MSFILNLGLSSNLLLLSVNNGRSKSKDVISIGFTLSVTGKRRVSSLKIFNADKFPLFRLSIMRYSFYY